MSSTEKGGKQYEQPLDLLALASAGLLEPEEIEAAEAAEAELPELQAKLAAAFFGPLSP